MDSKAFAINLEPTCILENDKEYLQRFRVTLYEKHDHVQRQIHELMFNVVVLVDGDHRYIYVSGV
jgi:hypothetical protein